MKLKDIPNLLTLVRILFVPVLILTFVSGNFKLCAIFFALSGISDVADGFVARRFGCESAFGKVVDPIADKLTYATVFFCLFLRGKLPLFFIIIYVAASVFQGIGAIFAYKVGNIVVKSDIFGKISGFTMFIFCFTSLLFYDKMEASLFVSIICGVILAISSVSLTSYFAQYVLFKNSK